MTQRPVAFVTGGAKRVGKAIVEDLASHGFDVVIHANTSLDAASAQAAALDGRDGCRAFAVAADLTDMAATCAAFDRAVKMAGPISLLVNNASVFDDDGVGAIDWSVWDRHFAVHLKAPVALSERMVHALPADADGLVVNIIDQRVWALTPKFFSYTLSKSALWTATRTMAQALAPRVRVNAIGPGPTLKNERQDAEDFNAQVAALPLQAGPSLNEFGATIRWMWAARSLTGQMIALDGGQHLAWETPDAVVKE